MRLDARALIGQWPGEAARGDTGDQFGIGVLKGRVTRQAVQTLRRAGCSPRQWPCDQSRAVARSDPNWHARLEGFPRRAYDYDLKQLVPRGFRLNAEIPHWPGGMPGDVGFIQTGKPPDEEGRRGRRRQAAPRRPVSRPGKGDDRCRPHSGGLR